MVSLLFLASLLFSGNVVAENWSNWRGPTGNGVVADSHQYPTEWSKASGILWQVRLPEHAGSTPAVWGDRIFLTTPKDGVNTAMCFNAIGKPLWETALGEEVGGKHKKASGSNPSPVTDGDLVFVYFKSGDLAALTTDGDIKWQKNLQKDIAKDTLWWDLGTSPVLTKNHVVVACIQSDESYVAGFDKQSGEMVWKVDRNMDAPSEANQSYSTPVVVDLPNGDQQLVILGADHVTGHDATDGQELWRVGGLNPDNEMYFRSIASAAVADGIAVAPYARGDTLTAIRLGGSGDVTKSHVLWTLDEHSADVPTPIAIDGKTYICGDKGKISCLETKTGDVVWEKELKRNRNQYSSSPVLVNGKIYVTREDAVTSVLDAETGKLLATNELGGEFTVATPVFVGGRILIRTSEFLYCVGK